jgi:c(7)-type cytochrome triheme protein
MGGCPKCHKKESAPEAKKEEAAPAATAAPAAAAVPAGATGPEFIKLEKTGTQAAVNFPHKMHGEKNKCDDCHAGDAPIFGQKVSGTGFKMKDMYAGKFCGACHNGKKAFKAMGGCMKCHPKAAK